ncbi:hypothetical protein JCM9279_001393 [Rhodotorula babjevae]
MSPLVDGAASLSAGFDPRSSPARSARPALGDDSSTRPSSQDLPRSSSTGPPGEGGAAQLRRRSSATNLHSALVVVDDTAPAPTSTAMERVSSLTTFMKGGGPAGCEKAAVKAGAGHGRELTKRGGTRSAPSVLPFHRRRLYATLVRLGSLAAAALCAVYVAKLVVAPFVPKVQGERIFNTLETVPYPLSTHPRTPRAAEQRTLAFSDYLTTRLGSHFSSPAGNLPGRTKPGSQLWLTTATNQSVAMGARHLVAFAERLETTGGPSAFGPVRADVNGSSAPLEALENREQHDARRRVVTLCQDEACMDFCRRDPQLFCFGGFFDGKGHRPGVASKVGGGAATVAEIAKLEGIMEALQSGRRVFWVDDGTYFKEDPVPYMGDLGLFDMQIPESWTTGRPNSGFSFFAPTQRVISLFDRLLVIARHMRQKDRDGWASTNLLLDPSGEQQYKKRVPPSHKPGLDENLYDDEPDTAAASYGSASFESPWDGGIDVRVLDPQRFKTSEGRLGRRLFAFEKERQRETLYWHCACCGDSFDNDYISGALGFYQPSITYSFSSNSTSSSSSSPTLPSFPLVLRVPELRGKPAEIQFAMSLLLQIAHDSGRVLVPPLTGFVRKREHGRITESEKYVWRILPAPLWAHPNRAAATTALRGVKRPPAAVQVREPGFVQHAVEYLRAEHFGDHTARQLVSELEMPLVLDMREIDSLKALVTGLTQPFWSTERVVEIEQLEQFRGKKGWELRKEFEGVSMCRLEVEHDGEGSACAQLCPL